MKPLACIALAVVFVASPALAASSQCRSIQSRKERNACYEQQDVRTKRVPTASESPKMNDAIDQMKLEDDRLTKRLQGICRGC